MESRITLYISQGGREGKRWKDKSKSEIIRHAIARFYGIAGISRNNEASASLTQEEKNVSIIPAMYCILKATWHTPCAFANGRCYPPSWKARCETSSINVGVTKKKKKIQASCSNRRSHFALIGACMHAWMDVQ